MLRDQHAGLTSPCNSSNALFWSTDRLTLSFWVDRDLIGVPQVVNAVHLENSLPLTPAKKSNNQSTLVSSSSQRA